MHRRVWAARGPRATQPKTRSAWRRRLGRAKAQALTAAQAAPGRTAPPAGGDWNVSGPTGSNVDTAKKAADQAAEGLRKAKQNLLDKMDALEAAVTKGIETRQALRGATSARDALKTEFRQSDLPQLRGAWAWIDRLRTLRQALTAPDLTTDASVKAFERLTTGNLSELGPNSPADNPPLVRLLDIGFFNPVGKLDLAFFEEMAHSGFWPGASWNFGSVDSMHFELAEGRNSLLKPGKS